MKKYIIGFILVLIASSATTGINAPAKMGTMISDVKPSSEGMIVDEGGIGEVNVNEGARIWRYGTEVSAKHPNRRADSPRY